MGKVYLTSGDDFSRINDKIKELQEEINNLSKDINGALIPAGSVLFADLEKQTKKLGYTYNITDAFTTNENFREGAGVNYGAGANVYWTVDEKWDVLAPVMVTGVKGANEQHFRQGEVSLSAEDVGALPAGNTAESAKKVANPLSVTLNGLDWGSYDGSEEKNLAITAETIGALSADRGGTVSGDTTFSGNFKMTGKSANTSPSSVLGVNASGDVGLVNPNTYLWPSSQSANMSTKVLFPSVRVSSLPNTNDNSYASNIGITGVNLYDASTPIPYGNLLRMVGTNNNHPVTELVMGWLGKDSGRMFVRTASDEPNAGFSDWAEIYTTQRKPTPDDIGALAKTAKATSASTADKLVTSNGGLTLKYLNIKLSTSPTTEEGIITEVLKQIYIIDSSAAEGNTYMCRIAHGSWTLLIVTISSNPASVGALPRYCQGMVLNYSGPNMFKSFQTIEGVLTAYTIYNNANLPTMNGYALTPSNATQTVPCVGKYMTSNVTVDPIPSNYKPTGTTTSFFDYGAKCHIGYINGASSNNPGQFSFSDISKWSNLNANATLDVVVRSQYTGNIYVVFRPIVNPKCKLSAEIEHYLSYMQPTNAKIYFYLVNDGDSGFSNLIQTKELSRQNGPTSCSCNLENTDGSWLICVVGYRFFNYYNAENSGKVRISSATFTFE